MSKLTNFELILGPWSTRLQNGMMPPDKFVLGRFVCSASPAPEGFLMIQGGVVGGCTGELRWPDEHMWSHHPELTTNWYEKDSLDYL